MKLNALQAYPSLSETVDSKLPETQQKKSPPPHKIFYRKLFEYNSVLVVQVLYH